MSLKYIWNTIFFTGIQLEKPTKITTSLTITNPTLASNYCIIDSTGIHLTSGLAYGINGIEYFATKTTDNLNVGTTNKYYLTLLFNSDLATKTTDNLNVRITNKYYLTSLFNSDLTTKSTTNLSEGTNLYYTASRFYTQFGLMKTIFLSE